MKFLMIIIFAFAINCFPQLPSAKKNTTRADNIQLLYVYCFAMYSSWTEVSTVTDNKDGTVSFLLENVNPCGGKQFIGKAVFKKCIQGQVYRTSQNDCKGTGSSADYYGAQKFQWCPTNDTSCDVDGDADVNKSPAAISCDKDSTGGIKWKIFDSYPFSQGIFDKFINRDEIPKDFFWIDLVGDTIQSAGLYLTDVKKILHRNKNLPQYVLCYNQKGI